MIKLIYNRLKAKAFQGHWHYAGLMASDVVFFFISLFATEACQYERYYIISVYYSLESDNICKWVYAL